MRWIVTAAAAATLLAGGASALTIVDSSFEGPTPPDIGYNPRVAGASFVGNAGIDTTPGEFGFPTAPDGAQVAFLQSGGSPASISLDVSGLTIGQTYDLQFYVANRPSYGTETLTAAVDEGQLNSVTAPSDSVFTQVDGGSFMAVATTDVVTFSVPGVDGDNDIGLDQVTLNGMGGGGSGGPPAGAPEPAAWALMILGMGFAGAGLRRRSPVRIRPT